MTVALVLASTVGAWINNPTDDPAYRINAQQARLADAANFASGGIAHGLAVTVNASDEVSVTGGSVAIDGGASVSGSGFYRAGFAPVAPTLLEGRDATNPRVDLVVARQYDPEVVPAHGEKFAKIEVIKGDPAASPSPKALPDLAIELARISVPASGGAAASVDNSRRVLARSLGGTVTYATVESSTRPTKSTAWTNVASSGIVRSFVAPPSGRVKVTIGAYLWQQTTGERQLYGYRISGGMTRDPLDSETVQVMGQNVTRSSTVYVLQGLTPGTSYTLTEAHRVVNTSATDPYMAGRSLLIEDL